MTAAKQEKTPARIIHYKHGLQLKRNREKRFFKLTQELTEMTAGDRR